jgi:very-short-patch-repair endonuclease
MPVKNIIPGQKVTKEKLHRAKELRREMTPAEKILWNELRANKLGVHFRRQQVIVGFIVDFYCHKAALVVEVDGDIHDLQKDEDARREKVLSEMGLRIVRFRNDEVVKKLPAVLRNIGKLVQFDKLIQDTHKQAKEAGVKPVDITTAITKARAQK